MAWTKPLYDRLTTNKAAKILLDDGSEPEDVEFAFAVVNNWRSAHGYPLQCIKMMLLGRAHSVDPQSTIAQRLKRLPSILAKLEREPTMSLTQMQDIGGCRAVLSNIKAVDQLTAIFDEAESKNPHGRHKRAKVKDYIVQPKEDGYRSIHYVYKYYSKSAKHSKYNDQKIEIQVRSRLQHTWATALEIVDAFTGQALKSALKLNLGDPNWRRFFALMGTELANRERRSIVPKTPVSKPELKEELQHLANELNVRSVLGGLNVATNFASTKVPNAVAYLLELNLDDRSVRVTPYAKHDVQKANEDYLRVEKKGQDNPKILSVLVSVETIKALRTAYPNYYLDAQGFLKALDRAIK